LHWPFATFLLAGLGARVIKVENPAGGDLCRENAPYLGAGGASLVRRSAEDVSVSAINRLRNKLGITLNLKHPEARPVLADLVKKCDVLVGHIEVPHTRRGHESTSDVPAPPSSPDNLAALKGAEFHVATLAGNHVFDAGSDEVEDTVTTLRQLGLSRTPVHKAIRQLLGEGLLEEDSTGSTVVVRLSSQDFVELYELRSVLEAHAVSKIAKRTLAGKDLERLQAIAGEVRALRHELVKSEKRR
jgi:hypothetical protein